MTWTLAVLVVAAGTYLLRFLPLTLALRDHRVGVGGSGAPRRALALAAPALVAALLVTAALPPPGEAAGAELARRGLALASAAAVFRRYPHLAAAVLAGVAVYAALPLRGTGP